MNKNIIPILVASLFAGASIPYAAENPPAAKFSSTAPAYRPPVKVPETGIGFRGDGTGVFPDSRPPTQWNEATGKNIRWKTPVPNWGLGCPTPVGNRVLVMSEPTWQTGSVWPELLCYDADTGALVWRQTVDPFLGFPEVVAEQRKQMTDDVHWSHDLYRKAYQVSAVIAEKGGAGADSPEMKLANEELAKSGLSMGGVRMSYGQLRSLRFDEKVQQRFKEADQRLRPYGVFRINTWDNNQRCRVGTCFPTPVSDGEGVYVMTAYGTVACYGMDGALRWCRASRVLPAGNICVIDSPRLYGDLLLTSFYGSLPDAKGKAVHRLIAWDKKTGERRWAADGLCPAHVKDTPWASRPGASLTVMNLGKTPVVLTWSGNVIRLPDGKVFDAKIGPCLGTWAVDDEKDAIFSSVSNDTNGPRFGLDLTLAGEELQVKVRYLVPKASIGDSPSMVFHAGRLFWTMAQLDPATGLPLGVKDGNGDIRRVARSAPNTRHLLLIANGHVYGLHEQRPKGAVVCQGVGEVFALDGKSVASNELLSKERSGEELTEKWQGQGFERSGFSYGCPFNIGGDRIYIRSEDYLYCIGEK
jgi:outer membrane protein assembly factor BamB